MSLDLSASAMIPAGNGEQGWDDRMTINVLLVDDHELIRQGLRRAFERDEDFAVTGEASSLGEARRLMGMLRPDVVILDVRLPDGSGLDACRAIRAESADMGIVMLTMYAGDDQLWFSTMVRIDQHTNCIATLFLRQFP